MSKFNFMSLKQLDGRLGGADFVRPATVYVALYTVMPTGSGGGTEVSGNGYARVAVTNSSTNWPAASGSTPVKANGTAVTFPTVITAPWGTVVGFGIFDAASAGNGSDFGALATPRLCAVGDTPSFAAGALTINEA
jgi:hypothetical protein